MRIKSSPIMRRTTKIIFTKKPQIRIPDLSSCSSSSFWPRAKNLVCSGENSPDIVPISPDIVVGTNCAMERSPMKCGLMRRFVTRRLNPS